MSKSCHFEFEGSHLLGERKQDASSFCRHFPICLLSPLPLTPPPTSRPCGFFFPYQRQDFFPPAIVSCHTFFCLCSLRSSSISPSFFLSVCTSYSSSSLASPFFVCRRRIICEIQTDETCKTCETHKTCKTHETQETCDNIKFV